MSRPGSGRVDGGAALVVALVVTAILTVLGMAYILTAETERRIAENERLSAQAFYAAEAGARQVKRWFDRPADPANLANPPLEAMDRAARLIDVDGDPATPPTRADGSPAHPYYKQGVDADGDGEDDVFGRPYRGGVEHALLGSADGPDVRIDRSGSESARSFLDAMSHALLGDHPGGRLRARVVRIDVFAPPTVELDGAWTRQGIGTIGVTAGIVEVRPDGAEAVLATRRVEAVLNEIPYATAFGPAHSCADFSRGDELGIHWGASTALGASALPSLERIAQGPPRAVPSAPEIDLLFHWNDPAAFAAWKDAVDGGTIQDPWYRHLGGGAILSPPGDAGVQPWPPSDPAGAAEDHSNLFRNLPGVGCPNLDYPFWKSIATSGFSDARYYVWAGGETFSENGHGPATPFRAITDGAEGILFFDTADQRPPRDEDADGVADNLTPPITLTGGTWGFRGVLYLNAEVVRIADVRGRPATLTPPGEPFRDGNRNGIREPDEDWLNLAYPEELGDCAAVPGACTSVDGSDATEDDGSEGVAPVRNARGSDLAGEAVLWGILFNRGEFEAAGDALYYGSVISAGAFRHTGGAPDLYWDGAIARRWPPAGWDLPRVAATRWKTEP